MVGVQFIKERFKKKRIIIIQTHFIKVYCKKKNKSEIVRINRQMREKNRG
jgi:hypothetical protein